MKETEKENKIWPLDCPEWASKQTKRIFTNKKKVLEEHGFKFDGLDDRIGLEYKSDSIYPEIRCPLCSKNNVEFIELGRDYFTRYLKEEQCYIIENDDILKNKMINSIHWQGTCFDCGITWMDWTLKCFHNISQIQHFEDI